MKRYHTLLASHPLLRRLAIIQLISYFAAWFSNVAIYTLLLQLNTSALVIAFVAALHFLPGVLQAPFSGVLIDRIAPKQLMIALMTLQIFSTLPLMLIESSAQLWLLFSLIFIRMAAASFYFTLEMALLPRLLKSSDLKLANEIHSMIWSFSYTIGMALSGLFVYAVGIKTAFLLDAMLYAIALTLLISQIFPRLETASQGRFFNMLGESVSYLTSNPLLIHLMLLHALVSFTTFDALVALIADQFYAGVIAIPLAIGLIHAFRAIGLVIGPVLLAVHMTNARLAHLLLFQGLAIWLWAAVVSNFYLSLAVSILVGLGTTTLWSYTYTLIQHHTDSAFYGRVVAYNDMLFLICMSIISMVVGAMAQWNVPIFAITLFMGFGFMLGVIYFLWIKKHFHIKEVDNELSLS